MESLSSIGKSEMMQAGASVAQSQRFNGYPSSRLAEIAARVVNEFNDDEYDDVLYSNADTDVQESREKPQEGSHEEDKIGERTHVVDGEESGGDEEDDSDFEFSVLCGDEESLPISADEIFYNGQIRPIFPIFNTDLVFGNAEWNPDGQKDSVEAQKISNPEMICLPLKKLSIDERETTTSCSSSETGDLESVPPGIYCVWTPKHQEMQKKSNSTGSSKRWKFRNLLHRSSSDGKDTIVFLTPSDHRTSEKAEKKVAAQRRLTDGKSTSSGQRAAKAHEAHYLKNRAIRQNNQRKSFLPYRQDLVGFFASVNGLSTATQPF